MRLPPLLAAAALGLALAGPARAQDADCAACHEAQARFQNRHLSLTPSEVQGRTVGCAGCHGDPAKHLESGEARDMVRFQAGQGSAACLQCHRSMGQGQWHASAHANAGVSCNDCHKTHAAGRPEAQCASCHAAENAAFRLPSRHPLQEGRMTCVSCHDPHAASEAQLKTKQRANDTCYRCHQDKEGPFVFEHDPVQEDCRLCHAPHGSVANKLLVASEPMLCAQCHELHFHGGYTAADGEIEIGGIHRESSNGALGLNRAFNTKCTQCHTRVHGSDLPSQGVSSRGRSLTR